MCSTGSGQIQSRLKYGPSEPRMVCQTRTWPEHRPRLGRSARLEHRPSLGRSARPEHGQNIVRGSDSPAVGYRPRLGRSARLDYRPRLRWSCSQLSFVYFKEIGRDSHYSFEAWIDLSPIASVCSLTSLQYHVSFIRMPTCSDVDMYVHAWNYSWCVRHGNLHHGWYDVQSSRSQHHEPEH